MSAHAMSVSQLAEIAHIAETSSDPGERIRAVRALMFHIYRRDEEVFMLKSRFAPSLTKATI